MDALAEHRERSVGKKKNALRPRTKGVHHQFAVIAFGQQNGSDLGIRNS